MPRNICASIFLLHAVLVNGRKIKLQQKTKKQTKKKKEKHTDKLLKCEPVNQVIINIPHTITVQAVTNTSVTILQGKKKEKKK